MVSRVMLFLSRLRWAPNLALLGALLLGSALPALATPATAYTGSTAVLATGSFTLGTPMGLAAAPNGTVYCLDSGNNRVLSIDRYGTVASVSLGSLTLGTASAIAVDPSGTLYVADTSNNQIVSVTSGGTGAAVTTTSFTLSAPAGVAADYAGTLYIADTGNNRILKVSAGTTTLVAPGGITFNQPKGLAVDGYGNLFVADSGNNRIVKVTTGGIGSTVAWSGGLTLNAPSAVSIDQGSQLYILDAGNSRVLRVTTAGAASAVSLGAFSLSAGAAGIAVDPHGTVYIADSGASRILTAMPVSVDLGRVTVGAASPSTRTLQFLVGGGTTIHAVQVLTKGATGGVFALASTSAVLDSAYGSTTTITVDVTFQPTGPGLANGAVVLLNASSQVIAMVPICGIGEGPQVTFDPGAATSVILSGVSGPFQVAFDGAGNGYVTSYNGSYVKKFSPDGSVTSTVATGSYTLSSPTGVTVDGAGTLYISDYMNSRIVMIPAGGTASLLNITGLPAITVGGVTDILHAPTSLGIDAAGNLMITDYGSGRILRVTPTGEGSVVAVNGVTFGFTTVTGTDVDEDGTVYVANRGATPPTVVKITTQGVTSTLDFSAVGTMSGPFGLATDRKGTVYVMDSSNVRLLRRTAAGDVSVVSVPGSTLNVNVFGITPDGLGNVYVADFQNNRVVRINSGSTPTVAFASTSVGGTSAASVVKVFNLGNTPLSFKADPLFPALFPAAGSPTNPITSATVLAPGQLGRVSFAFQPAATGAATGDIPLSDDHLNATGPSWATQTIHATGTGFQITLTPATLANATVGTALTRPITAAGGTSPYTYAVSSGTLPAGLTLSSTGSLSGTPTAAATSSFTVTATDRNGAQGSQAYSLTVDKGVAVVSLGGLAQTYTGSPCPATATTTPSGLTVTFTYDGSSTAPTAAGSYAVVATVTSANYVGTASGTLVIAKAAATITLGGLTQTYTGSPLAATTTTTPGGLAVALTYNGSATAPTVVGSYAVVATLTDPNYVGTASGTLVISKAVATVTLGGLTRIYTGSPLAATATTTPSGLGVALTYNGSATAPTAAGSYPVVATLTDSNYSGSASGTLVIAKAPATITLGNLAQNFTGAPLAATATTSPAGLSVALTYAQGGNPVSSPTAAGQYDVTATITDPNYTGTATGTLVITDPTIVMTPDVPALSVGAGGTVTATLTLASGGVPLKPMTLAATGLPPGATAIFSKTVLNPSDFPATIQIQVKTSSGFQILGRLLPRDLEGAIPSGALLMGGLALPFFSRRRRKSMMALLALAALGVGALTGCSGSSNRTSATGITNGTTPGTYLVTVTASSDGVVQASCTLNLTITR